MPAISRAVQQLGPGSVAIWAAAIPPVGYSALGGAPPTAIAHPVAATHAGLLLTLSNGLVSVTLDGQHGGGPELIIGLDDDITYLDDGGDVYGAFFGDECARASRTPARVTVLA